MGILGCKEKKSCSICGGKTGLGSMKCADGMLCNSCFRKVYKTSYGLIKDLTLEDINKKNLEEKEEKEIYNNFKATRQVEKYFSMDENKKLWFIPDNIWVKKTPKIYSFNDIVSFELIEDNDILIIKKALIKGAISNKVIKKLYIKITIKDFNNPVVMIKLIDKPTKTYSITYKLAFKAAQEILSLLELIVNQCESESKYDKKNENDINSEFIFCRKCRNKMQSDSVFCSKCGEKI